MRTSSDHSKRQPASPTTSSIRRQISGNLIAKVFCLVPVLCQLVFLPVRGGNLYWDSNGSLAGAGGTIPSGIWGVDNFWSTNSTGLSATAGWTNGETAIFSAGTDATGIFTVNILGTQAAGGIAVEEGNLTLSGGVFSLSLGASVAVQPGRSLTVLSEIAGGAWSKTGGGNLSLNASNIFIGPLTITGSAVRFNDNNAAGTGAIIVSPTTDVLLQASVGDVVLTNSVVMNTGANVDVSALSGSFTLAGDISGARSLWSVGGQAANTVVLGGNSTFSGNVDILGGTLVITRDNALGNVGGTTKVTTGATLGFRGGVTYSAAEVIKLFGDGVGGLGAVRNISEDNLFSGPIDLQSSVTIGAITDSLELQGTISGAGLNVTKVGDGRIIISGLANSWNQTFINAGTLQVETALGLGAVTVSSGATLSGNGVVAGAVALSGEISPAASPGSLNTGSQTWNPSASYLWEINDADFGVAGNSLGWDLVDIAGTLTINATTINKFQIKLTSLDSFFNDLDEADDFNNASDYIFIIAKTSGGIIGFDATKFSLDETDFINDQGLGKFVVDLVNSGNDLALKFVHPAFITTQPASTTNQCGVDNVTFTVGAGGSGALGYQWFRNGIPLVDAGRFLGATSSSLTITPVHLADSANYSCVITNIYGTTNSAIAVLTVIDSIAPGLTCPAPVTVVADAGTCAATNISLGLPIVTDSCDATPVVTNNAAFSYPVGTNIITWGATDGSGNHSECQQLVVVIDSQSPLVAANAITNQLDNAGNYTLSAGDIAAIVAGSSDNCGIATTNLNPTVFSYCNVGVNNVTVTLTDIHGNVSNRTASVTITAPATPSIVYVDDDYPATCAAVNFPSNGLAGPFYVGFNAFNTIQAGVDAVAPGGTVYVAAGTYAERVIIAKTNLTVQGAGNASIVTGTASAPGGGVTPSVFKLAANNVTLTGFRVLVDFAFNHSAVHSSGNCTGLTVSSNSIVPSGTPAYAYGLRNAIAINPSIAVVGYSQVSLGYAGVAVIGNVIESNGASNFRAGIQMDLCGGLILGNTSTTINHDFLSRFANQGDIVVSSNNFYGGGAQVGSFNGGVGTVTITNNVFDNSIMQPASGPLPTSASLRLIYYAEVGSVANSVLVADNTFQNHRWGVSVENFKNVTFDGNTFTPKAGATDYVHVSFNTKIVASTSASPTLNMFAVGANLTGNIFNGSGSTGGTALLFKNHRSTDAVFGTYTLGTLGNENDFNNGIAKFIALDASAGASSTWVGFGEYTGIPATTMAPWANNLDAQNNRFDVGSGLTLPAAMSLADLFATEDRITHAVDTAGLGFVRVKPANVYVTINSGSIQRGINPATSGDIVNVNDGSYTESLNVNKALTLKSANGFAATTIGGTSQTAVTIAADDVEVRGFTVTNPGGKWGVYAANRNQVVIAENRLVDIGNTDVTPSISNFGIAVESLAAPVNDVQIVNNIVSNLFGGPFKSAQAIAVGFSTGSFDITGVVIRSNLVSQVTSSTNAFGAGGRGAYGIILNHTTASAGKTIGALITENEITDLTGLWAHGIGLEGNTPGAVVQSNIIARLTDYKSPGNPDAVGVMVEQNASADTVVISLNSFTNVWLGVRNVTALSVNAESNWWAAASGPAAASNPGGLGVAVSLNVDFSPWLGIGTDTSSGIGFQPYPLSPVSFQPDHLIFATQPGNAALNALLSPQPVVHVIDENGGLATQYNGSVTLGIGNNPGGGVLVGTVTVPVVGGIATFTDLSIAVGGGEDFTLVATTTSPVTSINSATFDIGNPVPGVTSLNPFWKRAGDPTFTLTVTGNDFVPNSEVLWNGSTRVTAYVNPTTLTVSIPATDIAAIGTASVSVSNPPTAGGVSANLTFRIEAAIPAVVYVDDDYTNNAADDLVNFPDTGGIGTHILGYDAFATIQGGVNAVTNTGTAHVAVGTYGEDVNLNKVVNVLGGVGGESLVIGPIGGAGSTFTFTSSNAVLDGFTITRAGNNTIDWNNPGLNSAGVAMQGLTVSGTVRNCLITGMRTAIDINNSGGSFILNNVITNNRTGLIMRNQTDNLAVVENIISDNWTVGVLFLDASGGTDSPVQRANNCSFTNNSINGNWYGQIVDRQTGGSLPAPGANLKNFSGNWLGTSAPVVTTANSTEPGYAAQIPVIFGGVAVAPGGQPDIAGAASANVDYTPWLDVGTDIQPTFGFQGDFATLHVDDNSPQVGGITRIQEGVNMVSGSTVLVAAGSYSENVSITSKVTIDGAGSGTGVGDSIVIAANSALPVFLVTDAGGVNASDRLTIKDLRVTGGSNGVRVDAATGARQWFAFENLVAVNNSSAGIALGGVATLGEVQVTGCALSNNGGFGLHVADTLSLFASLAVTGGSMDNNGAVGLSVNGANANLASPTQISVTGTTFSGNGNQVDGGNGDVSFFLFNGDAALTNVTITADAQFPIQLRGKGTASSATWLSSGTVHLQDVTVSGATSRPGLYIVRYTNVANVSFENVNLSGLVPPTLPSGFGAVMHLEHTGATPLSLHGLKLKSTTFGAPFTNGYLALAILSTGGAIADCTTEIVGATTVQGLEAAVFDQQDLASQGDVVFPALTLTPLISNVIAECTGGGAATVTFTLPTVIADCAPAGPVICTPPSGSVFALGTNTVNCVVTDSRGISNSVTFLVTVLDTTAPDIISCAPGAIVAANATCQGITPDLTGLVTATDGCGSGALVVSQSPLAGSSINLGANLVTLTATDPSGNFSNCVTTVTVVDLSAPVVTSWPTNRTLSVGAGCDLLVPDLTVEVLAADNCSATTVTQTPLVGTLVSYGVTVVTVTATDLYGNATNNNTTLTVVDNSNPTITCPGDVVVNRLDATDPFATGIATAADNCTNVTVVYNDNRSGLTNCNATGVIYRTWTATDGASNVTACVQTITVIDSVTPLFTSTQTNITAVNDAGLCSAVVNFPTPTAVDVGYDQGFENVAWVSGGYVNQPSVDWNAYSSSMVRVPSGTDGIPSKTGGAHAVINSMTLPASPFDYSGAFNRMGGYSSIFGSGFRSSVDVFIDLSDPTVTGATPTIGYGWDVSTAASSQSGGHLRDFIFHAAAYGVTSSNGVVVAASNNSGGTRRNDLLTLANHYVITNTGWFTFEWVFRDNGGVLAVDCNLRDAGGVLLFTETRSAPSDLITTVVGGNRYMWFTFLETDKLAIDNTRLERNASVVCTPASGSPFDVGINTVTCVAADACGNTATNTFTITVEDTENPTINCPTDLVLNADLGQCSATVILGTPATADNCSVGSITNNAISQTQFPVGTNFVTWTVTDIHSNSATCLQTVIVLDNQLPQFTCPAALTNNADLGQCSATFALAPLAATDNCGVANVFSNAPPSFPVGLTLVTWTVIDIHGNTNTCIQTVAILDTQLPQITAGSIASCYETSALAEAAAIAATSATDNCGVASISIESTVGTCSATITVRVTDIHGNFADATYLTRIDATAPTIGLVTATEVQTGGPVNVKDNDCLTNAVIQGTVLITVVASDDCSFVGGQPSITLVNGTNTESAIFISNSPPGTYNYSWNVTSLTANGTWTATVAASDICHTTTTNFTLCVNKSQVTGLVQLEGFNGNGTNVNHARLVTFVASGGITNKTWNLTLTNVSGDTFSYTLTDVPAGTAGISAKTTWNLREKLAVTLDIYGQATADFVADGTSGWSDATDHYLRGGDLAAINPLLRDNQVQFFDYTVLGNNFFTFNAVADITGDGQVDYDDYFILYLNWFTFGDAE